MTAPEVELRQAVYAFLQVKLAANAFTFNTFTIRQTWQPRDDKSDDTLRDGVLSVVAVMSDQSSISRARAYQTETQIHLIFQKNLVAPDDFEEADEITQVIEEMRGFIRTGFDFAPWAWLKFESYLDSSNPETGINPVTIRQGGFEILVIATFKKGAE